ncbi:response regulator [Piscinibacter gummiphilus]|uniref:Virulence sensor protein BvgS n=1 Tax=Piscinibacter gummiphilus TaxID=946333 RepID=A0A1W6L9W1_9BURK|nr:response regulator [Piscinibacter gummiphilus]ARN21013.1 histidine kinase [Piscinibacter gummiphilus]ATU65688.1 histidine kinase [Piscinibacter gummiphilus]GLS93551.1 chemotaxis protein CheY [Piscinibacter gummiphilus]
MNLHVDGSRNLAVQVGAAALMLATLAVDLFTPVGYAEWALFLVPVGLLLLQTRPQAPLIAAAVASAMSLAGYLLSPAGTDAFVAGVNRVVGGAVLWALAFLVWQVLRVRLDVARLAWLQQGETIVSQRLIGEHGPNEVADRATQSLCEVTGADTALLYRIDGPDLLRKGGHAVDLAATRERIPIPDGLAGQVARDGRARVLDDVPPGHLPVTTALGRSTPGRIVIAPLRIDGVTAGVVELGFLRKRDDVGRVLELLDQVAEPIGLALRSALYRRRLEVLLEETQRQGESLQAQQEELRVSNEELEEQSRVLLESQARLETQQVELEQTNVQLEEQAQVLERQKLDLLAAQQSLHGKTEQLEAASRYKSEFLANMSHELRTPLNSSLILSKLLADNKPGSLNAEQVKYAQAIHASNNDLLLLINDILDLSKIEAGHVDLHVEPLDLADVVARLRATFDPLARQKKLSFVVETAPGAPATLQTDGQRLLQVLKNLLANGIKFTERGEVRLVVRPAAEGRVAFDVIDSGVGIPKHQQDVIFEAFRQADGSTSRRFGGTGLGLSISRELTHRLGGTLRVDSEPGRGSTFTVDLPVEFDGVAVESTIPAAVATAAVAPVAAPVPAPVATAVEDDRRQLGRAGRLILVIEDDPRFSAVLYDLAHELGFDCVIASTGEEGLRLARELQPSGVLLDVGLPDQSGLTVLERLKRDTATRPLPVHMLSAHERTQTALELGAVGYVLKPAAREQLVSAIQGLQDRLQREVRRVLVVEDDEDLRRNLVLLLSADGVVIDAVGTVADALERLSSTTYDCMVMDLSLSDGSGDELLEKMAAGDQYAFPPVIVYTGRALSGDEEQRLRRYSKSIIVKGARSPERLLDEVTLFLHSVESSLPPEQQRLLMQARERDSVLDGRRVLLAEDDVRNIFALSSVFEPLGAKLEVARNGQEALDRLERGPAVDLVLMDIMMPEMDGLTAMKHIRERPEWANLPIIALTAKAMPDDRDRCLEAGANDYVAKPLDVDKLISLCRVWMPK